MTQEVFEKSIDWVLHFARQGTQRELNLFGVGEPTLHTQLVEFVQYARYKLPFKQILHLNTNGNTMTEELAIRLKNVGISEIDITAHNARSAAKTRRIFMKIGINHRISIDFVINPNNWAGQVDWFEPEYDAGPCPWLGRGQIMVMSNGDITTCCIDAFATNVFANILEDDLTKLKLKPFALCEKCHHTIPRQPALTQSNPIATVNPM